MSKRSKTRRVPSDSMFTKMLKNLSPLKGSPLYDPKSDNLKLLKDMSPEKSPLYKPKKKTLKQRRIKGTAF
jgi:hypothetical protein